jgi:hypothetical protein
MEVSRRMCNRTHNDIDAHTAEKIDLKNSKKEKEFQKDQKKDGFVKITLIGI